MCIFSAFCTTSSRMKRPSFDSRSSKVCALIVEVALLAGEVGRSCVGQPLVAGRCAT